MTAKPPAKCGTASGYRKHRRFNEDACGACLEAERAHQRKMRADRARRTKAGIVEVPLKLFAEMYFAAPTPTANKLDEHFTRDYVDALISRADQMES